MKKLIGFIVGVSFMVACNSDNIFEKREQLSDHVLVKGAKFAFDFQGNTEGKANLSVSFRYATYYPFKTINLGVKLTDSKGNVSMKLLDAKVKDDTGNPIGDAAGDIVDLDIPVFSDTTLNDQKYHLELINLMDFPKVPGVMEIGVSVLKSK